MIQESKSYVAIPPGVTIKEQLEDRGMSSKEFAARMGLSKKHVSELINGKTQLTQEVALKLSSVLGIPASFWNNLERIYREQETLVKDEKKMDNEIEIAKLLPYADCANLGWLPKTRSNTEKVRNLRSFFKVSDLGFISNNEIKNVAYRILSEKDSAQLAAGMWIQKVQNESEEIESEKINIKGLSKNLTIIRDMTTKDPEIFIDELKELLLTFGVKLIILPSLKNSYLHGATFLHRNSVVLGITARGRDADRFWFSLFHELGHIIEGHIFENEEATEMEEAANLFAKKQLIPDDEYDVFIEQAEFNRTTITNFANEIGIDKGIVLGRLQNDGHLQFNQFVDMKIKYEITE